MTPITAMDNTGDDAKVLAARNAISESLSAIKSNNAALQLTYLSEYKEKFIEWSQPDRPANPQRSFWSPNAVDPTQLDASKWRTEYDVQFVEGTLDKSLKPAGLPNALSGNSAEVFKWKPEETQLRITVESNNKLAQNSEYNRQPAVLINQNYEPTCPNVIYPEYLDATQWKSEIQAKFKELKISPKITSCSTTGSVAGIKNVSPTQSPSNFAWKLIDRFAGIEAEDPNVPPGIYYVEKVGNALVPEAQTESSRAFVWQAANNLTSARGTPSFSSHNPTAPNAVYVDALNASEWVSEYGARCAILRSQMREELSKVSTKIAGLPTPAQPLQPNNFSWPSSVPGKKISVVELSDLNLSSEGKIDSRTRQMEDKSSTEYKDNFGWNPIDKKIQDVPSLTSMSLGMYDFSRPDSWQTEYDDRFGAISKIARPTAPVTVPTESDDSCGDSSICCEQSNDIDDTPEERVSTPDTVNEILSNTEAQILSPGRINAPEASLNSKPLLDGIYKISTKKRYTTEYSDSFQGTQESPVVSDNTALELSTLTPPPVIRARVPEGHMDMILCSGSYGNLGASTSTTGVNASGISLFLTESKSQYSWPEVDFTLRNKRKSSSLSDEPSMKSDTLSKSHDPDYLNSMTADSLNVRHAPKFVPSSDKLDVSSTTSGTSPHVTLKEFPPKNIERALLLREQVRPRSAPVSRRKANLSSTVQGSPLKKTTLSSDENTSNPIFLNRRYPGNSDRQIGRWTSEAQASYTWKKL